MPRHRQESSYRGYTDRHGLLKPSNVLPLHHDFAERVLVETFQFCMCSVREAPDDRTFIKGVIEGFYGRPWTSAQRKELFRRLKAFKLNAYFYAPKDDRKHRSYWRERYDEEEIKALKETIDAARDAQIDFVFAISPGIDIVYSDETDRLALRSKLEQVIALGCRHLAILFDDVDPELSDEDITAFQSLANAEAQLVNGLLSHFDDPRLQFFLCPNQYCSAMASPSVLKSKYLKILGNQLRPEIHIMWTGPHVVADYISVAHLQKVRSVLRRKPVIWDNLHANDYDSRKLFIGPYTLRSPAIIDHVEGIFLNPNCEFEANFVPLCTLGAWWQMACENGVCGRWAETSDQCDSSDDAEQAMTDRKIDASRRHCDEPPEVDKAIRAAVEDWCEVIEIACGTESYFHGQHVCIADKTNSFLEDDKSYLGNDANVGLQDIPENRSLVIAKHGPHLSLLIDLFYLPCKLSCNLRVLLQIFHDLCNVKLADQDAENRNIESKTENDAAIVQSNPNAVGDESDFAGKWSSDRSHFHVFTKSVYELLDWLTRVPNQRVKVDFMPYVSEVAGVLKFCEAYLDWLGARSDNGKRLSGGCKIKFKPWLGPGGTAMAFQKILFGEHSPDYPVAPVAMKFSNSISLSPMLSDDKDQAIAAFHTLDRKLLNAGEQFCAFVLRDSDVLRGVMIVSPDLTDIEKIQEERAQHEAVLEYELDKVNAGLHVQILFTAVFATLAHEKWRTRLYAECQLGNTARRAQLHALGFSSLKVEDDKVLLALTV